MQVKVWNYTKMKWELLDDGKCTINRDIATQPALMPDEFPTCAADNCDNPVKPPRKEGDLCEECLPI